MSEKPGVLVVAPLFSKSQAGMGMLKERYEVMVAPEFRACPNPENVQAIVFGDQKFGEEEMAMFPNLKTLARNGTGYDNVDLAAAKKRGIVVTRTSAASAETVSEYAIGLLLALSRNIVSSHELLAKQGQWLKKPGVALSEMAVGIVGLGAIGRQLTRKLHALGVKRLLGWNRTLREDVLKTANTCGMELKSSLEAVLSDSDAVVLCLALTPDTKNILNYNRLRLMKFGAMLVNVGRGALVDEAALAELMEPVEEGGRLSGVALDVFSVEPSLNFAPFEKLKKLTNIANIILTPHIGYAAQHMVERVSKDVATNVISILEGRPEEADIISC